MEDGDVENEDRAIDDVGNLAQLHSSSLAVHSYAVCAASRCEFLVQFVDTVIPVEQVSVVVVWRLF